MKIINLTLTLCILMCLNTAQAQKAGNGKNNKYVQTTIQTNGTCEKCKNTIENNIAYEKGVKDVMYDLASAKVTIIYNPAKNTVVNLCKAINKLGFSAEETLPSSCRQQCNKNCHAQCGNTPNAACGQGHACAGEKTAKNDACGEKNAKKTCNEEHNCCPKQKK
ncbi:MAG: heavy-metal-associated domain-containing protein [Bacteroidales bacterium]|nr:heavy-metal-associated domain-containing protein [Bacteroidales bacterium]